MGAAAIARLASAGPLVPPAGPIGPTGKMLDQVEPRTPIVGNRGPHLSGVTCAAGGVKHPEVFFFDETEDASHTNAYLVITTKAGPKDEDFKMIWD